ADELGTGNTGESEEEERNSDNAVEPEDEEGNESGNTDESKNDKNNVVESQNKDSDDDLSSNDTDTELIPEEAFDESESVYFVTESNATNNYFENPVILF